MKIVLALIVLAGSAQADVDWAKGLVTGDGLGIADRHAPSPATARGTSRRVAEDAGRHVLAAKIAELPVAGGGTVGAREKDPAVKARLDAAIADAYAIAGEPETDGAWRVTMAVPIEAVRQALDGPRELPAGGDRGPPIVVIDGAGKAKPAVGWTVGGVHAATVWTTGVPAWAAAAPHVSASKIEHGAIEIAGSAATPAALFVIATE
ncbi:MAG TPA: hypothetical protein VGG74_23530 [Kofleriaceae bacterium]